MSHWHDIIDWVGGYPYEVARPEEVFDFYRARGFTLVRLKAGGVGLGCNEFVFEKRNSNAVDPKFNATNLNSVECGILSNLKVTF
jgi:hypothetical protein